MRCNDAWFRGRGQLTLSEDATEVGEDVVGELVGVGGEQEMSQEEMKHLDAYLLKELSLESGKGLLVGVTLRLPLLDLL